jgi:hypothetical protein
MKGSLAERARLPGKGAWSDLFEWSHKTGVSDRVCILMSKLRL